MELIKFIHLDKISKSDMSDDSDFEYLEKKKLIYQDSSKWVIDFVGEIITPHNTYFSLPKKFDINQDNIDLIKKVLDYFEKSSNPEWKTLIFNQLFEPTVEGDFESEKYYFNELKTYFLDYITYEFIYPLNRVKVHSGSPVKGGKLDVLSSSVNRKRFGTGFTYTVKDIKNSDDWMIDDIYYHTLKILCEKYGSESDKRDIEEMKTYLDNEGYEILLDQSGSNVNFDKKYPNLTSDDIIESIHRSTVGPIHYAIRDTLLEYWEGRKMKESSYKIRVFYTKNFEKVWEELVKKALYHDPEFKKFLKSKFKFDKIETISKWFRTSEISNKLKELGKGSKISDYDPNIIEWEEKSLEPDIFSYFETNDKIISFLGDAKYTNNLNSEFGKEMNDYNEAVQNKYPMCIFCCDENTGVFRKRTIGNKELIIFSLSTQECIDVAINRLNREDDYSLIFKVHRLIEKYTRRKGPNFSGGF